MPKPFKGMIKLDVRDSMPDWEPLPPPTGARRARRTSSIVLYDDTGLAAWSPFGGRHQHADAAAARRQRPDVHRSGTRRRCARRRARRFLTGRNHHQNGMRLHHRRRRPASRAPTRTSRRRCATIGRGPARRRLEHVLGRQEPQRAGRRVARWARRRRTGRCSRASTASTASSAARPTSGIPTLVEDNHYIDQPYPPEEGYHLSKDLADQALQMIRDSKQSAPSQAVVSCGSARAPTTRRTTRRRSTSTSTRASSTTATRPTASGCCRG